MPDGPDPIEAARTLARLGVPFFTAEPVDLSTDRWAFPAGWQNTAPGDRSLEAISRWKPGTALCAVTGHVLDVLDRDPRNGGHDWSALLAAIADVDGLPANVMAQSFTPSGGEHAWIWSLGLRKHGSVVPGIDYQGGDPAGEGRGFVYVPPTVRVSKATGQLTPYAWGRPPPTALTPDAVTGPHTKLARWLARQNGNAPARQHLAEHATPEQLLSGLTHGQR